MSLKIIETVTGKLSPRDRRALRVLGVFVAALVVFLFVTNWFGHWVGVRKSLAEVKAEMELINPSETKQDGLLSIVPVFEMPEIEERQKFLFREKFNEQLKKAGIKNEPLQVLAVVKLQGRADYKLLRLKCRGKCQFGQALDLLAVLKENPYLVGIEEFKIECDPKKRQEVEMDLTVSTFVKSKGIL